MQRVMIIGQPGSGKSRLARAMGEITGLPVVHIDHIHWQSGWVERPNNAKDALCAQVHSRERWIFEGGRSATWPERLRRCDTLIWLDFPIGLRGWRVFTRTLRHWRRTRPDLPDGCPETFNWEFARWIWDTRDTSRNAIQRFFQAVPPAKTRHRFGTSREVAGYLNSLKQDGAPAK